MDDIKAMPIGTVVADTEGYWRASHRRHVKTGRDTWAVFFHQDFTPQNVRAAIEERRNNLSPGPTGHGVRITTLPKETSNA